VEVDDVVEDALVVAVGDEDDLQLPIPVLRDGAVEDLGEELASLLDGIEARGPEEDGRGVVHLERETLLEFSLGGAASDDVRGGIVAHRKSVVDGRIVVGVRRVENALGAAGGELAAHLLADLGRDEVVHALDDLAQEGGAHGVDVVGGEDAAGEQVDAVGRARLLVVPGRPHEVELLPELGGVDARVLDALQRDFLRMDVVDGEQARDAQTASGGGDEPGHPVVAVDEVGLDGGDDVVDHLALERESQLGIVLAVRAVHRVPVVEHAVLREVDARVRQLGLVALELAVDEAADVHVKHLAIVRQRDVDVRALLEERAHERSRHVRHAAGLGGHAVGHVAHAGGQVGDLRRDDEYPRRFAGFRALALQCHGLPPFAASMGIAADPCAHEARPPSGAPSCRARPRSCIRASCCEAARRAGRPAR